MLIKKEETKTAKKASEQAGTDNFCTAPSPTQKTLAGNGMAKAKTKITIKFNVGFPNTLTIRGKGANLSWDKGVPLKNIKADEWVWETETNFTQCEFKVLVNDVHYEMGANHIIQQGATLVYTPRF